MKFEVVAKIVRDRNIVGYKIHSGFSIFYILPLILKQAILAGLVENQENEVEEINYNTVQNSNDGLSVDRLEYALKTTSLDKLKEALILNNNFTTVVIDILEFNESIKSYRVDASNNSLIPVYHKPTYLLPKQFDTLYNLVDFFSSLLNRQYINVVNILEYIKEEKGSTIFTCDIYEKGKKNNEVIEILHNKGVIL